MSGWLWEDPGVPPLWCVCGVSQILWAYLGSMSIQPLCVSV